MNKRVSDKSTKAEILEAYKEAAQEKAQLESQIQQLNASQKQTPAPEKPIVEAQKPMALTQNAVYNRQFDFAAIWLWWRCQ
jgi:hypothetical protein